MTKWIMDTLARLIGHKDVEKEDTERLVQLLCGSLSERDETIAIQCGMIAELNALKDFLLQALIDAGAVQAPDASLIESSETATSIEELPITLRSDALKGKVIQ